MKKSFKRNATPWIKFPQPYIESVCDMKSVRLCEWGKLSANTRWRFFVVYYQTYMINVLVTLTPTQTPTPKAVKQHVSPTALRTGET